MCYGNIRKTEDTKQDYAIARLNATVANLMAKTPMPEDKFLIKFTTKEQMERDQEAKNLAAFEFIKAMAEAQKG
jgi:hypothetical protein